jgi:hypothetical protein
MSSKCYFHFRFSQLNCGCLFHLSHSVCTPFPDIFLHSITPPLQKNTPIFVEYNLWWTLHRYQSRLLFRLHCNTLLISDYTKLTLISLKCHSNTFCVCLYVSASQGHHQATHSDGTYCTVHTYDSARCVRSSLFSILVFWEFWVYTNLQFCLWFCIGEKLGLWH